MFDGEFKGFPDRPETDWKESLSTILSLAAVAIFIIGSVMLVYSCVPKEDDPDWLRYQIKKQERFAESSEKSMSEYFYEGKPGMADASRRQAEEHRNKAERYKRLLRELE